MKISRKTGRFCFALTVLLLYILLLSACSVRTGNDQKQDSSDAGTGIPGSQISESTESENTVPGSDFTDNAGLDNTAPGPDLTDNAGLDHSASGGTAAAAVAAGEMDTVSAPASSGPVVLGDERSDIYLPLLSGKRVALFSNQSGIVGNRTGNTESLTGDSENRDGDVKKQAGDVVDRDGDAESRTGNRQADDISAVRDENLPFGKNADGTDVVYGEHILDALVRQGVNVTAVFSPEHGFRGTEDAGAGIEDSVDEKTGIPIRSLYGSSMYPSDADLEHFDTLVIDIQDVGLRYYTYYISMYYLMDVCASAGKEVVILDRPNPNGFYVDGPVLRNGFESGIGILPLPVVHGMTLGELGQMINGEGWLPAGTDACRLTVVPCGNYTHHTITSLVTRPSPNLKDMRAIYLYSSTCYFENTAFSIGRGTDYPFEIYGSPYLTEMEEDSPGLPFSFTPVSMEGAVSPPFEGQLCNGRNLRDIPLEQIRAEQIDLRYLIDAYSALQKARPDILFFGTPDGAGHCWIDYLCGTDEVRNMIEAGCSAEEIETSWREEIEEFRIRRQPYLLYEE